MDTMINDPLRPNLSSRLTQQDLINKGLMAIGMAPMGITKAKTAYELAHDVASKNAEKMLGLPKGNTYIDRRKALGMDNNLYHGALDGNQSKFIASAGGELGPGVYVAKNPALSNEFARTSYGGPYPEGAGVYPVATRKLEEMPREKWVDIRGKEMDRLRAENKGEWNPDFYYQSMKNMADDTTKAGNSGWYTNAVGGADQGVVFNPSFIRSRFAAFDPARIHEDDLLAGLAPYLGVGGLLGLGMYGKQDRMTD
jgi:hypothetical protein